LSAPPAGTSCRRTATLEAPVFQEHPAIRLRILESGEKLEGTVFFPNGDSYGFDPCFGDENRFYPEELFRAGDYELRKVGRKGTTLEAFTRTCAKPRRSSAACQVHRKC